MANNGGRQGGGAGNGQMNEHVEFTVKVSNAGLLETRKSPTLLFVERSARCCERVGVEFPLLT
jgi:hypothetical protein